MTRRLLVSLACLAALWGGAWAAGPTLDLSQPPDPQAEGGPVGDGEDWTGDGRADVIGDDGPDMAEKKADAKSDSTPDKAQGAGPNDKADNNKRKKEATSH